MRARRAASRPGPGLDGVPARAPEAFDAALDELDRRVTLLAPRLAAS